VDDGGSVVALDVSEQVEECIVCIFLALTWNNNIDDRVGSDGHWSSSGSSFDIHCLLNLVLEVLEANCTPQISDIVSDGVASIGMQVLEDGDVSGEV